VGLAAARKAITYVLGNALIAVEMTRYVPAVGLYVPLRVSVEAPDATRVIVTYDLPSATVAQFGSSEVDQVAANLDEKLEELIGSAVGLAQHPASGG